MNTMNTMNTSEQAELPGTEAAPAPLPTKGKGKAPTKGKGKAPTKGKGKAPTKGKGKAPTKGKGKARHPNEPAGDKATHYTDSDTRKYQANGPTSWATAFRQFAGRGGKEGEGIRMALAFAACHAEQVQRWKDREEWRHAARRGGE